MTTSDSNADVAATTGWRFKVGIGLVVLALVMWLSIPLAASLGMSGPRVAALTGAVFVANKVLLISCIAVMGKEGFRQLTDMIFGQAKRLAPPKRVGPVRHVIGLVMFTLPIISAMLETYVDNFWPGLRPNLWQAQALGDLMLIASFFVLGGDFWKKIRALFIRTA